MLRSIVGRDIDLKNSRPAMLQDDQDIWRVWVGMGYGGCDISSHHDSSSRAWVVFMIPSQPTN